MVEVYTKTEVDALIASNAEQFASKFDLDNFVKNIRIEMDALWTEVNALKTPKPLLKQVFAINSDAATIAAVEKHGVEYIANFRTSVLSKFYMGKILNCHSIEDIKSELANDPLVGYICYDNEPDNATLSTPSAELVDPAKSTNEAMLIIKNNGYKTAVAPSRAVLLQEYEGVNWSNVDMLVMQLQKVVGTIEFKSIADRVTAKVKSQNPNCLVFAQVNPALNTAAEIKTALASVKVDGVSVVWQTGLPIERLEAVLA